MAFFATGFDPYRKWLGVPEHRRPPTYYDILGISRGENDDDVIRSAAEQRRVFIQGKKGEGYDTEVEKILREIDESVACLLVPSVKSDYDRRIGIGKNKGKQKNHPLPPWFSFLPVRIYGEGSGIISSVAGIMLVICLCIGAMFWLSSNLPKDTLSNRDADNRYLSAPSASQRSVGLKSEASPTPDETPELGVPLGSGASQKFEPKPVETAVDTSDSSPIANLETQKADSNRNPDVKSDQDKVDSPPSKPFQPVPTMEAPSQTNLSNDEVLGGVSAKAESKSVEQNENLIGSTLFRDHHYKVFHEAGLDWTTAKNRCAAIGGHLVTISDEQENKFMIALATKTIGDINNSGIWLGATDERNEGQWEWLDGTPFKYTNWNGAQPNGKDNENYLLLLLYFRGPQGKESRGWCDQPMAGKIHVIYYACEWDSVENHNNQNPAVQPEKTDSFEELLQGEWKCVAGDENGKTQDKSVITRESRLVTIDGNSLTMARDGAKWTGKFEIDAESGSFDWIGKNSAGDLIEWIGIYKVDADELKLNFIFQKNNKARRPTQFKSFPPSQPGLAHANYSFVRQ